jgi:hypothetical protein
VPYHSILSDAGVMLNIMTDRHPSRPSTLEGGGMATPNALSGLVLRCWDAELQARPTTVKILDAPYFIKCNHIFLDPAHLKLPFSIQTSS